MSISRMRNYNTKDFKIKIWIKECEPWKYCYHIDVNDVVIDCEYRKEFKSPEDVKTFVDNIIKNNFILINKTMKNIIINMLKTIAYINFFILALTLNFTEIDKQFEITFVWVNFSLLIISDIIYFISETIKLKKNNALSIEEDE